MARPTLQVELENIDDVVKALESLGVDITAGLEAICKVGAEAIKVKVEGFSPHPSIGDNIVSEKLEGRDEYVTFGVGPTKSAWIAHFFEYGTRAHTITAKNAQALSIYYSNAIDYRTSANVPGMTAEPFMRPGFDAGKETASKDMQTEIKRITGL